MEWSFRIKSPLPDVWEGKVVIDEMGLDKTAEELLHAQRQTNSKRGPKTDKVGDFADEMRRLLKDGDMQSSEVMELLKVKEFGESTIRAAKKALRIESVGKSTSTQWHLPADSVFGNDSVVEKC